MDWVPKRLLIFSARSFGIWPLHSVCKSAPLPRIHSPLRMADCKLQSKWRGKGSVMGFARPWSFMELTGDHLRTKHTALNTLRRGTPMACLWENLTLEPLWARFPASWHHLNANDASRSLGPDAPGPGASSACPRNYFAFISVLASLAALRPSPGTRQTHVPIIIWVQYESCGKCAIWSPLSKTSLH
ncbi:uncharacterized protein VTP21DRAFT_1951 [Calcarisporiella thermophila]|uniref:uncharacterized protein n=1 Tax=Calcarisporiella thermophila TaxID=911321 RepID=UPI0037445A2D